MAPEILQPDSGDEVPAPTQEVEFALMLSRVIDSVKNNPEYLRATIYELARYKLKEQFKTESFADERKFSKSLEIAIQGVEAFNKKREGAEAALPEPEATQEQSRILAHATRYDLAPVSPVIEARLSVPASSPVGRRSKAILRFAAVFAITIAAALAAVWFDVRGYMEKIAVNRPTSILPKVVTSPSPQPATTAVDSTPAAPSPALPTSFGVYAVSDDKLHELDLLPTRAPDPRVAISSPITTQSRTMLPHGHLTFIVYRRDSATNAADRAEVRLIARIEREASFDKDGKQVVTNVEDSWAMRNISIPYRTSPKKDNPDMYEVRSENPDIPLAPGRYALVLKGLAYDFSVAGSVTDPRQCLERLMASNGQFYSECKKQ
jgi:hypothetical protein